MRATEAADLVMGAFASGERGERPARRKIGFTNRTIWPQFDVRRLLQPHIEPEIQLHFARV